MGRGLVALLIAIPLIGSCTETLEVAKPPEACSLISDTVLHIGEMLRTEVCFEDDDVASLTYDVRSSDPEGYLYDTGKAQCRNHAGGWSRQFSNYGYRNEYLRSLSVSDFHGAGS